MLKRLFDLSLALLLLPFAVPIMGLIALMIKGEDRGPVFYRGVRTGRHGVPFRMFKFRTMVVNADRIGGSSTADNDPRITYIGRMLRKTKLDELPQLLNILKGEMSFVGPRPEVPMYTKMFSAEEQAILSLRPGITDWASIWNPDEGQLLAGRSDPDAVYLKEIRPIKLKLQLKYVKNHSFKNDIKILLETIGTVMSRRGS